MSFSFGEPSCKQNLVNILNGFKCKNRLGGDLQQIPYEESDYVDDEAWNLIRSFTDQAKENYLLPPYLKAASPETWKTLRRLLQGDLEATLDKRMAHSTKATAKKKNKVPFTEVLGTEDQEIVGAAKVAQRYAKTETQRTEEHNFTKPQQFFVTGDGIGTDGVFIPDAEINSSATMVPGVMVVLKEGMQHVKANVGGRDGKFSARRAFEYVIDSSPLSPDLPTAVRVNGREVRFTSSNPRTSRLLRYARRATGIAGYSEYSAFHRGNRTTSGHAERALVYDRYNDTSRSVYTGAHGVGDTVHSRPGGFGFARSRIPTNDRSGPTFQLEARNINHSGHSGGAFNEPRMGRNSRYSSRRRSVLAEARGVTGITGDNTRRGPTGERFSATFHQTTGRVGNSDLTGRIGGTKYPANGFGSGHLNISGRDDRFRPIIEPRTGRALGYGGHSGYSGPDGPSTGGRSGSTFHQKTGRNGNSDLTRRTGDTKYTANGFGSGHLNISGRDDRFRPIEPRTGRALGYGGHSGYSGPDGPSTGGRSGSTFHQKTGRNGNSDITRRTGDTKYTANGFGIGHPNNRLRASMKPQMGRANHSARSRLNGSGFARGRAPTGDSSSPTFKQTTSDLTRGADGIKYIANGFGKRHANILRRDDRIRAAIEPRTGRVFRYVGNSGPSNFELHGAHEGIKRHHLSGEHRPSGAQLGAAGGLKAGVPSRYIDHNAAATLPRKSGSTKHTGSEIGTDLHPAKATKFADFVHLLLNKAFGNYERAHPLHSGVTTALIAPRRNRMILRSERHSPRVHRSVHVTLNAPKFNTESTKIGKPTPDYLRKVLKKQERDQMKSNHQVLNEFYTFVNNPQPMVQKEVEAQTEEKLSDNDLLMNYELQTDSKHESETEDDEETALRIAELMKKLKNLPRESFDAWYHEPFDPDKPWTFVQKLPKSVPKKYIKYFVKDKLNIKDKNGVTNPQAVQSVGQRKHSRKTLATRHKVLAVKEVREKRKGVS